MSSHSYQRLKSPVPFNLCFVLPLYLCIYICPNLHKKSHIYVLLVYPFSVYVYHYHDHFTFFSCLCVLTVHVLGILRVWFSILSFSPASVLSASAFANFQFILHFQCWSCKCPFCIWIKKIPVCSTWSRLDFVRWKKFGFAGHPLTMTRFFSNTPYIFCYVHILQEKYKIVFNLHC
jgi:hypothetical protein